MPARALRTKRVEHARESPRLVARAREASRAPLRTRRRVRPTRPQLRLARRLRAARPSARTRRAARRRRASAARARLGPPSDGPVPRSADRSRAPAPTNSLRDPRQRDQPGPHVLAALGVVRRRGESACGQLACAPLAGRETAAPVSPNAAGVAADLVQRRQAAVAVERRVLDALRHRRAVAAGTARTSSLARDPAPQQRSRAKSKSTASRSGCRRAALRRRRLDERGVVPRSATPADRARRRCGTPGSATSSSAQHRAQLVAGEVAQARCARARREQAR